MDHCPELLALHRAHYVPESSGRADPKQVTRIRDRECSPCVRGGCVEQWLEPRITANDTVERHDVGRRQAVGERDEVALYPLDAVAAITSGGLLTPYRHVRRRGVDRDRPPHAALEELERQWPHARADVEERLAAGNGRRYVVAEKLRRLAGALSSILGDVLLG
jgi:hypothetical protein